MLQPVLLLTVVRLSSVFCKVHVGLLGGVTTRQLEPVLSCLVTPVFLCKKFFLQQEVCVCVCARVARLLLEQCLAAIPTSASG